MRAMLRRDTPYCLANSLILAPAWCLAIICARCSSVVLAALPWLSRLGYARLGDLVPGIKGRIFIDASKIVSGLLQGCRLIERMHMADQDQRRRRHEHNQERVRMTAAWAATGYRHPPPRCPAMPADLERLACGAKTRAGTPCKLTILQNGGRCKLHGGMSTGPKSEAGRLQAA